jgi:hypothetical protein
MFHFNLKKENNQEESGKKWGEGRRQTVKDRKIGSWEDKR